MPELFLVENQKADTKLFSTSNEVLLHEDILEVLFKYKEKICNKFYDIRGTFLIDHLAINIIDPNSKVIIFSTTPSIEYNLISQGLWKYDRSFSISYQTENRFYSWEKAYEEKQFEKLKLTKQLNHGFTCGFNLSTKIESFQFIYSFATRHQKPDLIEYYRGYINELFAIGNYVFKAINGIYEKRFGKIISTPEISGDKTIRSFSPFLKLIKE
jgi:hypothetical protein